MTAPLCWATLYCVGRDIEYREISLERSEDNLWTVTADSCQRPELGGTICLR